MLNTLQASVSHEILNPLDCVSSFAVQIRSKSKESHIKQMADIIYNTTKLLNLSVSDLQDRSSMQHGKMTVTKGKFQLKAAI